MLDYKVIGKGEPVFFIHGLGSRKEAWEKQHELAKDRMLIIPDLRGHGATKLIEDISLESFGDDILDLADHLRIDEFSIVGLSLGGIIAQKVTKMAPDRVKSLVLSNTVHQSNPFFVYWMAFKTALEIATHSEEEMINTILDRSLYNKSLSEEARNAFYVNKKTYNLASLAVAYADFTETLRNLIIPVLLIGSDKDTVTPVCLMRKMERLIWNSQMEVLEDTGHLSNIERPEEFNRLLDEFLPR